MREISSVFCLAHQPPVQDVLVFLWAQNVFETVRFKHLRAVVFPALDGEVDEVEPVLLLPAGRPQGPVRLTHHHQPGPVRHSECDVSEHVITRVKPDQVTVLLQDT